MVLIAATSFGIPRLTFATAKAAVWAHITRKNKKSAEQFKFFEHQTGIVYILKSP
ncbi:TPA: hypothetical protein VJE53_001324 [Streptococcus pyogenes]|nr:hypothetical protein [Streptococcus pyogenes]